MGVREDASKIPVWGIIIGLAEWFLDLSRDEWKKLGMIVAGLIFAAVFILWFVYL